MFSVYLENQNNKKLKVMEIDLPVSGKQLMEKLQNVLVIINKLNQIFIFFFVKINNTHN